MWGINPISSYLLAIGLLTLLVLIVLWQRQRGQKTIRVWLVSSFVGILLGSVGSFAAMHLVGYEPAKIRIRPKFVMGDGAGGDSAEMMGSGMGGMMGGGMGGMMGGGMFGGGRGPSPKRQLTTLVRKLELLTGDVTLTMADQQTASLIDALVDIEKNENMSDEEAEGKHGEILALFNENQKAKLEAIRLPRSGRGGGGRGLSGPGGSGGPGGSRQVPDANPFTQETNTKALVALRERFSGHAVSGEGGSKQE